jgi:hypothetical protein
LSHWRTLLDRTIRGLEALKQDGSPTPDWVLGGGTALMIWADHRLSRDIDAFIDDAQYLPMLSPRVGGEQAWGCEAYDEASHYLKLRYPEGEIDFIVAATITDMPVETKLIPAADGFPERRIVIEHPVEIALKKLHYRGGQMIVRDAFDICVVDELHPDLLRSRLAEVSSSRDAILSAADRIKRPFFDSYLEQLDIRPKWEGLATESYTRIREIFEAIPKSAPRSG